MSSRMSERGLVAVDQGGFTAVDQDGGPRLLSPLEDPSIPAAWKTGGMGGAKDGLVAKGCLVSSSSLSLYASCGGPFPGGG